MKNILQKSGVSLTLIYVATSGCFVFSGLSKIPNETTTLNIIVGALILLFSLYTLITFKRIAATEKVDHSQLIFEIIFSSLETKKKDELNKIEIDGIGQTLLDTTDNNTSSISLQ